MKRNHANGKRLATQQSGDQAVESICDIIRPGNCAGAMQYVPELTWILFLRILDEQELREEQEAEALGVRFRPSLDASYRWRDWGAPPAALPGRHTNKRLELQNAPQNAFFSFVNGELLPHLKALKNRPSATPRQKVISEIMTGVERVRIDNTALAPSQAWATTIQRTRHIGDFTTWKDHDAYQRALTRLLRDLHASETPTS